MSAAARQCLTRAPEAAAHEGRGSELVASLDTANANALVVPQSRPCNWGLAIPSEHRLYSSAL